MAEHKINKDLEIKRIDMNLAKANASVIGLELAIMEKHEEIKRNEEHIELHRVNVEKLNQEKAELIKNLKRGDEK